MLMRLLFLLSASSVSFLPPSSLVSAFPSQAGGCEAGRPAVDGKHLENENGVEEYTLSERDLTFSINNVTMNSAGNSAFKVRTGGDYLFQVTSREDRPFRGALIRVQQQNNEIFKFVPVGVEAQDTLACVGSAIGVTHRNNNPKTTIGGLFSTNSTQGDIFIDVTVVDRNDDDVGSIFSYTRYQIGVVSPSVSPTSPPTTLKTFRPTQTPSPTTTPYPTFADVCYVCGSEDMDVTQPDNTATLPGQVFSCRQLSVAASDRKIPPQLCPLAQAAATANCACALRTPAPSAAPTTPRPTPLATLAPTSTFYPTANSSRDQDTSCLLCGSNEQVANSNTTLAFDNALYTCGRLYKDATAGRFAVKNITCDDIVDAFDEFCECEEVITVEPTIAPTVSSIPSMQPVYTENCLVCRTSETVGNPDTPLQFYGSNYTCGRLFDDALAGRFDPDICESIMMEFEKVCACLEEGEALAPAFTDSMENSTAAPTLSPSISPAPTQSMAPSTAPASLVPTITQQNETVAPAAPDVSAINAPPSTPVSGACAQLAVMTTALFAMAILCYIL